MKDHKLYECIKEHNMSIRNTLTNFKPDNITGLSNCVAYMILDDYPSITYHYSRFIHFDASGCFGCPKVKSYILQALRANFPDKATITNVNTIFLHLKTIFHNKKYRYEASKIINQHYTYLS